MKGSFISYPSMHYTQSSQAADDIKGGVLLSTVNTCNLPRNFVATKFAGKIAPPPPPPNITYYATDTGFTVRNDYCKRLQRSSFLFNIGLV